MAFGVILYSSWNLVPLIFLFILHSQQLGPPGVAHLGSIPLLPAAADFLALFEDLIQVTNMWIQNWAQNYSNCEQIYKYANLQDEATSRGDQGQQLSVYTDWLLILIDFQSFHF